MSWIGQVSDEVSGIEKTLKAILNIDGLVADALWKRQARRILVQLRRLYFAERGTLGFLRRVAAGEPAPPELLERVKGGFFRNQHEVGEAIAELRRRCDLHEVRLPLELQRFLENMTYDKTAIREAVRDFVWGLGAEGPTEADRADAAELVRRIEALNAAFEEADRRLRG